VEDVVGAPVRRRRAAITRLPRLEDMYLRTLGPYCFIESLILRVRVVSIFQIVRTSKMHFSECIKVGGNTRLRLTPTLKTVLKPFRISSIFSREPVERLALI